MRCNWLMLMVGLSFLTLFFLQAADGIRYRNVTGVQTCALPISEAVRTEKLGQVADEFDHVHTVQRAQEVGSEERRVGKECRSRWWACHLKKKKKKDVQGAVLGHKKTTVQPLVFKEIQL